MSGFAGGSSNVDGYFSGIVRVATGSIQSHVVSPTQFSSSLDDYSIDPLPVKISSPNTLSISGDINNIYDSITFSEKDLAPLDKLRTTISTTVFQTTFRYDKQSLFWNEATSVSGGTTVHLPNEKNVQLLVNTTSDAYAIRQTKRHFIYHSGFGFMAILTFADGYSQTNVKKRIGSFDDNNGIFLEITGTDVAIVTRTSVSGSPVDTRILQSNWNIDKLDGTGKSGITLDFSKIQILILDAQRGSRCRIGFYVGGKLYLAHEIKISNFLSTTLLQSSSLPGRYEIRNFGVSSGGTLKQSSNAVIHENGSDEEVGIITVADTGFNGSTSTTTARSILCIKLRDGYNAFLKPISVSICSNENSIVRTRIILNPTLSGTLSWANIGRISQQSLTQLTYTSSTGNIFDSLYTAGVTKNSDTLQIPTASTYGITANMSGTSDILAVIVDTLSGSSVCEVSLQFLEQY